MSLAFYSSREKAGLVIGQVLPLGACGKSKLSLTFTAHSVKNCQESSKEKFLAQHH